MVHFHTRMATALGESSSDDDESLLGRYGYGLIPGDDGGGLSSSSEAPGRPDPTAASDDITTEPLKKKAGVHHVITRLRYQELTRLLPNEHNPQGVTPLDQAGAALYSERQLRQAFEEAHATVLSNPHSAPQPGSVAVLHRAELVRQTLAMCNAPNDLYDVVFTSGATAALKLVAECLPWCPHSTLAHLRCTHNSVLGMREPVLEAGGAVQVLEPCAPPPPHASALGTAQDSPAHGLQPQLRRVTTLRRAATGAHGLSRPTPAAAACQCTRACFTHASSRHAGAAGVSQALPGGPYSPALVPPGACGGCAGVRLAVLPHECNFTGQRLDLSLVRTIQQHQQVGGSACASSLAAGRPVDPWLLGLLPSVSVQEGTEGASEQWPQEQQRQDEQEEDACDSWNIPVARARPLGGRWLVLLDAAKSCATSPPDLARFPADMVALSFYKIMGYPTGLGALVVRREVLPMLTCHKRYFGGGTIAASVADEDWFIRRAGTAGLEDGTPAFAAIAAARHGFTFVAEHLGGWGAVRAHTSALAEHLVRRLRALRHAGTGQPLVVIYGRDPGAPGVESWGPTVTFNLKRADGPWVGYAEVGHLASLHGIQLRTGCFCNPGACAQYLGLTARQVRENHAAGHVCWDDKDLNAHGQPTGAVRASLGHLSCLRDVSVLIRFLRHYFLEEATPPAPAPPTESSSAPGPGLAPGSHGGGGSSAPQPALPAVPAVSPTPTVPSVPSTKPGTAMEAQAPKQPGPNHCLSQQPSTPYLSAMYIYPIKSCGAQQVNRWPVGTTGLLYDREWALLDDGGHVVTQKLCPRAALVLPRVDLEARTLTLTATPFPAPGPGSRAAAWGPGAVCANPLVVSLDEGADVASVDTTVAAASASAGGGAEQQQQRTVHVCGDSVCGLVVTPLVSPPGSGPTTPRQPATAWMRAWFEAALDVPCVLIRQREGARAARAGTGGTGRATPGKDSPHDTSRSLDGWGERVEEATTMAAAATPERPSIGFANDGQYLLVNAASVEDVNARLAAAAAAAKGPGQQVLGTSSPCSSLASLSAPAGAFAVPTVPVEVLRFRPNLVVQGLPAYAEDAWVSVKVGPLRCNVLGSCPRCEMLQVDQLSGMRGRADVLLTLAQYRRFNGRMHFGILLAAANTHAPTGDAAPADRQDEVEARQMLSVGDPLVGLTRLN